MRSAATVLATPMHAIGQQNALQPEFRCQYMQENKNVNNCSVYCTFQVLPRLLPESLSAVSGAPRVPTVRCCMLSGGALRIQRLEGSRPGWENHGLCTLNGSDECLRGCESGFMRRTGRASRRMMRGGALGRGQVEAARIADRAFGARGDNRLPFAPEHGQSSRMRIGVHAAHRPG